MAALKATGPIFKSNVESGREIGATVRVLPEKLVKVPEDRVRVPPLRAAMMLIGEGAGPIKQQ